MRKEVSIDIRLWLTAIHSLSFDYTKKKEHALTIYVYYNV